MELFNLINRLRTNEKDPEIINRLKEWRDSPGVSGQQNYVYLDFDGDGKLDPIRVNGGTDHIKNLIRQLEGYHYTELKPLRWENALYFAS